MPNITKAKLDELNNEVEIAKAGKAALRQRAELAESRVQQFNDILDKVELAARGQTLLTSNRDSYFGVPQNGLAFASGEPVRKIKTKERQAQEIRELNEHIAALRSRLTAVEAVTEFAQEHKA